MNHPEGCDKDIDQYIASEQEIIANYARDLEKRRKEIEAKDLDDQLSGRLKYRAMCWQLAYCVVNEVCEKLNQTKFLIGRNAQRLYKLVRVVAGKHLEDEKCKSCTRFSFDCSLSNDEKEVILQVCLLTYIKNRLDTNSISFGWNKYRQDRYGCAWYNLFDNVQYAEYWSIESQNLPRSFHDCDYQYVSFDKFYMGTDGNVRYRSNW